MADEQQPRFKNRHGEFPSGTEVYFEVENHFSGIWTGGSRGILTLKEGEWVIKNARAGTIGIGGYLEAYGGSIYPVDPSLMRKREGIG